MQPKTLTIYYLLAAPAEQLWVQYLAQGYSFFLLSHTVCLVCHSGLEVDTRPFVILCVLIPASVRPV